MKWLMENEIVPRLKKAFNRDLYIRHQTYMVTGYSESALTLKLTDFENNMPEFVKLAYLPQMGIIRLRLSAYYEDEKVYQETIDTLRRQLEEILEKNIIICHLYGIMYKFVSSKVAVSIRTCRTLHLEKRTNSRRWIF